jgi:ABC-type transporter Mla MlaB component
MRADNITTTISTVLVGELGTGEQLFLWALRQRLADQGETTPCLVRGFLLACGLAGVETTLGSFERLFDLLGACARCELGVCPLRCACLSRDEATCLALLAAAQRDDQERGTCLATALVGAEKAGELCREARRLALALARAGHLLTGPPATERQGRTVH